MGLLVVVFLVGLGYLEFRVFKSQGSACITWLWALAILVAAVVGAPGAGMLRYTLGAAGLGVGGFLIAWYYHRHRKAHDDSVDV